jgi:ribose transport system permease protein
MNKPVLNSLNAIRKTSYFSTLVVFVLLVLINALIQPYFFSGYILRLNLLSFTPLILIAMAQGVVILLGGVDLSIGAAITLMNVVMASIMKESFGSVVLALVVGLGIGIGIGLFNGFTIGFLKLPAIVATFASGAIWGGLALIIMPAPGGFVPKFFYKLYQRDLFHVLPVPLLLILIAAGIWFFLSKRPFYRHLYATGGNEQAAFASWINTRMIKLKAFTLCGVFTAIASYMVTMQAASGDPNLGQAFTLPSVAAVVIGGISLYGGRGRLIGAVLGACIFGLLTNIIYFAKISSFYQDLIRGAIIIIALIVSLIPSLKKTHLTNNG